MRRVTLSYGSLNTIELATLGLTFVLICFGTFAAFMGAH